jgi:uncharacterized Zn-finger protein
MNAISQLMPAFTKGTDPFGPRKGYPKFCNDRGVPQIHIDVKQFECIGASAPHDHPHIYLDMGEDDAILCPYCATRFQFDSAPGGLGVDHPDRLAFGESAAGEGILRGVRAAFDAAVSEGWPTAQDGSRLPAPQSALGWT